MDISESRMQRIQENCDRLGVRTTMLIADASKPPAELLPESLDAILADVPCSATGVMRRNPDIKILRQAGDIASFTIQQLAILKGLWPLLKPGGRLLYVTCSLLEQENDSVIETFNLANDCTVENISLGQGLATKKGWQLLPHKTGGDGLFFSLLRKPKT
jgi:16S rRNA (cytosine967-C5)-methyltransferase